MRIDTSTLWRILQGVLLSFITHEKHTNLHLYHGKTAGIQRQHVVIEAVKAPLALFHELRDRVCFSWQMRTRPCRPGVSGVNSSARMPLLADVEDTGFEPVTSALQGQVR